MFKAVCGLALSRVRTKNVPAMETDTRQGGRPARVIVKDRRSLLIRQDGQDERRNHPGRIAAERVRQRAAFRRRFHVVDLHQRRRRRLDRVGLQFRQQVEPFALGRVVTVRRQARL